MCRFGSSSPGSTIRGVNTAPLTRLRARARRTRSARRPCSLTLPYVSRMVVRISPRSCAKRSTRPVLACPSLVSPLLFHRYPSSPLLTPRASRISLRLDEHRARVSHCAAHPDVYHPLRRTKRHFARRIVWIRVTGGCFGCFSLGVSYKGPPSRNNPTLSGILLTASQK